MMGNLLEELVPRLVAAGLVDHLEMIDVDESYNFV